MKTYVDCGAGVAGDMLLSALIGLGLPVGELTRALKRAIPIKGWELDIKPAERRMWPAWSLRVHRDRAVTSTKRLRQIISSAPLPTVVSHNAVAIFDHLEAAEKTAHGHAHGRFDPKGLGRIDTLVDVLGNAWGLWRLGITSVEASPINTGRIAPATQALLIRYRVPVYADSPRYELATPTGVAILTQFARRFCPMPRLRLKSTGYGAGSLERKDAPNVLAIYRGIPA